MRLKSVAVQSNIDGLLLDKAVEYYGEEAERRWFKLSAHIQSPERLGKAFKRLEADLEWMDAEEDAKGATAGGSRQRRATRLSALLEERVTALRVDFEAQTEKLRAEKEDLRTQRDFAEERYQEREGQLLERSAHLATQIEELRLRNRELSEQLRSTLSLRTVAPCPQPVEPALEEEQVRNECEDGSMTPICSPGKQKFSESARILMKQAHSVELSELRSDNAALLEQLETKDFLLERKEQLLRCSRRGSLEEQLEAQKEVVAVELRDMQLQNACLTRKLESKSFFFKRRDQLLALVPSEHLEEAEQLLIGSFAHDAAERPLVDSDRSAAASVAAQDWPSGDPQQSEQCLLGSDRSDVVAQSLAQESPPATVQQLLIGSDRNGAGSVAEDCQEGVSEVREHSTRQSPDATPQGHFPAIASPAASSSSPSEATLLAACWHEPQASAKDAQQSMNQKHQLDVPLHAVVERCALVAEESREWQERCIQGGGDTSRGRSERRILVPAENVDVMSCSTFARAAHVQHVPCTQADGEQMSMPGEDAAVTCGLFSSHTTYEQSMQYVPATAESAGPCAATIEQSKAGIAESWTTRNSPACTGHDRAGAVVEVFAGNPSSPKLPPRGDSVPPARGIDANLEQLPDHEREMATATCKVHKQRSSSLSLPLARHAVHAARPPLPGLPAAAPEACLSARDGGRRGRSLDRRRALATWQSDSRDVCGKEDTISACSTRSGSGISSAGAASTTSGAICKDHFPPPSAEVHDHSACDITEALPSLAPMRAACLDKGSFAVSSRSNSIDLHEGSVLLPRLLAARADGAERHDSENPGHLSERASINSYPWVVRCEKIRSRSANAAVPLVRVVSGSGVSCFGSAPHARRRREVLATPRSTVGPTRKMPLPRAPEPRRDGSFEVARHTASADRAPAGRRDAKAIARSCELEEDLRWLDDLRGELEDDWR